MDICDVFGWNVIKIFDKYKVGNGRINGSIFGMTLTVIKCEVIYDSVNLSKFYGYNSRNFIRNIYVF